MNLDLAAIEADLRADRFDDGAHAVIAALLAAVRTLEAERDQAQAQAEDCVAVVDLWQAKGVKYEARVTALEEALKELVPQALQDWVQEMAPETPDRIQCEIGTRTVGLVRRAAALLTKEGVK